MKNNKDYLYYRKKVREQNSNEINLTKCAIQNCNLKVKKPKKEIDKDNSSLYEIPVYKLNKCMVKKCKEYATKIVKDFNTRLLFNKYMNTTYQLTKDEKNIKRILNKRNLTEDDILKVYKLITNILVKKLFK